MTDLTCISPIDGSTLVTRAAESADAIVPRLQAARRAQAAWREVPVAERCATVMRAVDALESMNGEIVPEVARMMGRPARYGGEIGGVRERAAYMTGIAADALAPTVIEDTNAFRRFIAHEPVGLVAVLAPWNYPYMTAINTIAPALAAGNAVALKHSTQTILAGDRLAAAFTEAGLPEDLFQLLHVTHDTMAELLAARAFDFVNFTGSVNGGRQVERAMAGTFAGLGLELGGKDPGYVREDADLEAAAETLIDGAMFNAGQCCCGIERIYVARPLFDAFVEKAVAIVEGYRLGDPLDEATTLGPMANIRFAREVRAQVSEAVAAGATPLIDPERFPADTGETAYVAPQILTQVDHTMRVMRDETFGPTVGIMPVDGDDEAVALMNDSPFGLTAALWTADIDAAEAIGRRIETGTVFMNRCDYLDPALCWTGCKETGRGAALSALGYRSVTRPKSYHLKRA